MEEDKDIELGSFLVYGLFFVLISIVFVSDLWDSNFGTEEEKKNSSRILNQSTFHIDSYIKDIGKANHDVIKGRDGWLFYRPYLEHFVDDRLNTKALEEINSMNRIMAERGIKLIVVPVPLKVHLHSDKLMDIQNSLSNYSKYIEKLTDLGVDALDLSSVLNFQDSFLKGDTHWSPNGVGKAARLIADKIDPQIVKPIPERSPLTVISFGRGNLSKSYSKITSYSQPVYNNGEVKSLDAEVLILGDSFANIFSDDSLGWGDGFGLVETLAGYLQKPVDKIAVNNGGESGSRNLLMDELSSGYDKLANKKFVIWEFHYSEFAKEEWSHFSIPENIEQSFLKVENEMTVTGSVLSVSHIETQSVYKDQLASVRMKVGEKQLLFRAFGKKDGRFTELMTLRPGDEIKVKLKPFSESLSKTARTEFFDLDLQLQAYAFGEIQSKKVDLSKWIYCFVLGLLVILTARLFKRFL